jgi:hypothetical protein
MDPKHAIDLDTGLQVSAADRESLRQMRRQTPSWLDLDWRIVSRMLPPDALALRPTANDNHRPFSLA